MHGLKNDLMFTRRFLQHQTSATFVSGLFTWETFQISPYRSFIKLKGNLIKLWAN